MDNVYVSMICSPEVYPLLSGKLDGMVSEIKKLSSAGVKGMMFDATDNDLESCPLTGGRASPFLYTTIEKLRQYTGQAKLNIHLLASGLTPMVARRYVRKGAGEITFPFNAFRMNLPGLESMLNLFRKNGHASSPPPENPVTGMPCTATSQKSKRIPSGISLPVGVSARDLNYRIVELSDYVLVRCQQGPIDRDLGHQELDAALDRVADIRGFLNHDKLEARLLVYGGVDPDNARQFIRVGADGFVVGSALFRSTDYAVFLRELDA